MINRSAVAESQRKTETRQKRKERRSRHDDNARNGKKPRTELTALNNGKLGEHSVASKNTGTYVEVRRRSVCRSCSPQEASVSDPLAKRVCSAHQSRDSAKHNVAAAAQGLKASRHDDNSIEAAADIELGSVARIWPNAEFLTILSTSS